MDLRMWKKNPTHKPAVRHEPAITPEPKPLTQRERIERLGKHIDTMGITLVNFEDPVDGSELTGLDWEQVERLVNFYETRLHNLRHIAQRRQERIEDDNAVIEALGARARGERSG